MTLLRRAERNLRSECGIRQTGRENNAPNF
uniref:Uncharacterized protein n=1 Tax=Rhizophora mucronata TaxID=61149 RepID=A0A2P2QX35_RHIMU